MQILSLKRDFEIMGMKTYEGVEEYGSRLMSFVNQIKLLGSEFSSQRVVDKLLVARPERRETKFSPLEDTKDLSALTFEALINSFNIVDQRKSIFNTVDQRRSMRNKDYEVKTVLLAKSSHQKGKDISLGRNNCQKVGHEGNNC